MSHMEVQLIGRQQWFEIDGPAGIEYVPCEIIPSLRETILNRHRDNVPCKRYDDPILCPLGDCCENETGSTSVVWGYGVRLSAPGYLEWEVFENKSDANERFADLVSDMQ